MVQSTFVLGYRSGTCFPLADFAPGFSSNHTLRRNEEASYRLPLGISIIATTGTGIGAGRLQYVGCRC